MCIIRLIKCRRWDDTLKRINECPHEIISHDYHETSTLHLACSYQAPIEVIAAIVSLHPELILVQEASFHYTPLHIVSHCYRLSLRSQGQRGSDYDEEVIKCLLKACPESISVKTTQTGWIPLHVICGQDEIPLSIMKLLVDVDPNTLHTQNTGGVTPMQSLCNSFLMTLMDDADGVMYSALCDEEEGGLFSCLESMSQSQRILLLKCKGYDPSNLLAKPLFAKIQYATRKLYAHNFLQNPDSLAPLLHSLAGSKILRDIVSLSIALYPSQTRMYWKDGLIPLHVAILSNGCRCGDYFKDPTHTCHCFLRQNPVDMFVFECRETARYRFKDKTHRGRFPLNVAIEKRIGWMRGLKALFLAAPEVAHERDLVLERPDDNQGNAFIYFGSGLYPFMLAATTMHREDDTNDDNEKSHKTYPEELEVIFELLRAAPELVKNCGLRQ